VNIMVVQPSKSHKIHYLKLKKLSHFSTARLLQKAELQTRHCHLTSCATGYTML
jgi:hypothetical protein